VRARRVLLRYPAAKHTSGSQTCPVKFSESRCCRPAFQIVRVYQGITDARSAAARPFLSAATFMDIVNTPPEFEDFLEL